MKQIFMLSSFLLFTAASNAQNIVPNFSFEEADSCPTNVNPNTYKYSLGCVGWGQATSGNPDYFNACDTATVSIGRQFPIVGVPHNVFGYQVAYEGVAYVGINMYVSVGIPDYKEYIITNIPALEIDTEYEVIIHVSLANVCKYATDGMGVFFTTYGSPSQYVDSTLIETPQIDFTSYGIISDTLNWTTLTGTFIADSAYTTLIIGGFRSSNEMAISIVKDSASNPTNNSYYYIDNVIVEKLSSTGMISVNKSEDVKIFPNPFFDHTTLSFNNSNNSSYTLNIFNMEGQAVKHIDDIVSNKVRIGRNNLPSGFYYYQLRSGDGIVANGKLIIQ